MSLNKTTFQQQVRSTHVDQFAHLNNAAYLEYFEWARWDWGEKNNLDFEKMLKNGAGPVVVRIEIDFMREVLFNEKLSIETELIKTSARSFTLRQTMKKSGNNTVSQCQVVIVFVDSETKKALPLPEIFNVTS